MIYNLQSIRAAAAILVFFYHSEIYWKDVLPSTWLFKLGLAGVDVFFVLSGFIMAATTTSRDVSATSFFSHRIFRVVPLYWIITLLFTLLFFSGFKPVGLIELTPEYLVKSLFFIPFLRGGTAEPIVTVGWTLNYEIFFYFLFSLCLFIPNVRARHPSVIILILLALLPRFLGSANFYAIYYGNPIILEFCLGIASYHCVGWMKKALDPKQLVPLVVIFIATSLLFLLAPAFGLTAEGTTSSSSASAFIRPFTWGLAGFLAILSAVLLERSGYVSRRGLVPIGDASYSIYLIHGLVLHGSYKIVSVFSPSPLVLALATTTIALVLSIAVGLVLFRYLESPVNKMLRNSFTRSRVTCPSPR